MIRLARLFCFAWVLTTSTAAHATCRQALALGLDVSGSVDPAEYRLQLDGLAAALIDPAVSEAVLQFPSAPVRLMVFEWSGRAHQRILVDWQVIDTPDALLRISQTLSRTSARPVTETSTAITAALYFGAAELAAQTDCWQKTLDLSGDGPANIGQHPGEAQSAALDQITVNGLVIGPQNRANTTKNLQNVPTLLRYYERHVLRGPGAFAETATDYVDFTHAMRRKLIRELDAPVLSRASSGRVTPMLHLSTNTPAGGTGFSDEKPSRAPQARHPARATARSF